MSKRKLKRQLSLLQVIMLGTAGTIAAEIFVLTGHAAAMAGPAAVLALLIGGVLSYNVALNYCELATTYPEAGGAMTYVREAFGNGILSYLVGSMDCISSTFYAALSAVGFAYSLQVLVAPFFSHIPIVPIALLVIAVFSILNILGVNQVGNAQVILGGFLLAVFVLFIGAGLFSPRGFSWEVFYSGRAIYSDGNIWHAFSIMLTTIALVYNAYVGFEVIADDAEEVSNPNRNIPIAILVSLTLCTLIYVLVSFVTLGTVPIEQLAGSETALTDAIAQFIPGWGVQLMGFAGIIATLTSVNSAMLSATREAFTLGRDGVWPRPFSKLNRFRTPYVAILIIGAISALVAAIGEVDFLSYISSSGYLFVLFWGSSSMLRLRKLHPNLERPFKVPFFPLTAYLAGLSCILIIISAKAQALAFVAGVLSLFTLFRYAGPPVAQWFETRFKAVEPARDRILIPVANPATAKRLVRLGSIISDASEDTYMCVLTVSSDPNTLSRGVAERQARNLTPQQQALVRQIVADASEHNVALYTKSRAATNVAQGILDEIESHNNVQLLLVGWPGPLSPKQLVDNPVKVIIQEAHTNVAVLLDRGLRDVRKILVPVGGGPHSRLGLHLADAIAEAEKAQVTALRLLPEPKNDEEAEEHTEEIEDLNLWLAEIVEEEFGAIPETFSFRVAHSDSLPEGVLAEAQRGGYDLIVMGASEEWASQTRLFGAVDDWVADRAPCSVVLCRRYQPVAVAWLRRQLKRMERDYEPAEN